jgi:hypothetical protein
LIFCSSSKRAFKFDDGGDRFARLGRIDQRANDGRLLAGAIERLLDRDDVGIGRRLPQEGEHDIERLVRVVDDDVLRSDRGEAIPAMLANPLGEARREGREFKVGPVFLDQFRQIGDAEKFLRVDDDILGPANLVADELVERGRGMLGRGSSRMMRPRRRRLMADLK